MSPEQVKQCLTDNSTKINADVASCSEKCPPLCDEDVFAVSMRFERSLDSENHNHVEMLFYYPKMTEKTIFQKASYHFSSLIANFGGTLGLMIGTSAISLSELLFWLVLFLLDSCDRCCRFDKIRKQNMKGVD